MARSWRLWLMLLVAGSLTGCSLNRQGPIATPDEHHVLVLPGINGGPRLEAWSLARRLDDRPGISAEVWDWRPPGVLVVNICAVQRNRACGKLLADRLVEWRAQYEHADLSVVAISGGTGVVLDACALLPDTFRFQRIVLVGSAVDPDRDLTPALSRVEDALYAYSSKADFLVLSAGTSLFCTMEGTRAPSAGYGGFRPVRGPLAERKFYEARWSPGMMFTELNFGSHYSGMSPSFVSTHMLPLFDPKGPTRSSIWKRPDWTN